MPQVRLLFAALLIAAPVVAQTNTTLLVNIDHRPATSLNGDWHVIVDQYQPASTTSTRFSARTASS